MSALVLPPGRLLVDGHLIAIPNVLAGATERHINVLPKTPPPTDDSWRITRWNNLLILLTEDIGPNGRWRHVSFSRKSRMPSWADVKAIRYSFFDPDVVVVQLFPEQENYVSLHDFTLHLWQWLDGEFPFPEAYEE